MNKSVCVCVCVCVCVTNLIFILLSLFYESKDLTALFFCFDQFNSVASRSFLWPIGHARSVCVFFKKSCMVVPVNCLRYDKHLMYYLPLSCVLAMHICISAFLVS